MIKVELTVKYIADAVIEVKKERFGEDFVSIDELIIIKKLIELRFKKMGYDANFGDVIFSSHFRIDNGVVAKTNLLTWEKGIEDEQVREIIYDKEFIYYCLCQILINKLNNSMEHNCKNCVTECTGLFCQSHSKPNDCIRWSHDFEKDCINNISFEERTLLEEEQNQQNPVKKLKKDDEHMRRLRQIMRKDFEEDE